LLCRSSSRLHISGNITGKYGRLQAGERGYALQIDAEFLALTCKSKEVAGRITSKGQVTMPAEIRERAGLLPLTEAGFEFDGKVVRIVRAKAPKSDGRGARLVAHLRGRGDVAMSTDAIMALTRDDYPR
jgi:bifunctional DNA-binding transcriptional regulator/antitoxin component of YhaV-PrlF toxin-antitoxin module